MVDEAVDMLEVLRIRAGLMNLVGETFLRSTLYYRRVPRRAKPDAHDIHLEGYMNQIIIQL